MTLLNTRTKPNHLLDTVVEHLRLKNDAELSRALEVAPPVISKIRHGRLPVGDNFICRVHEATGVSVAHVRRLAGLKPLLSTGQAGRPSKPDH
ncbi:MAG: hypothetical protein H7327_07135 [Herminiimonas sp.]|nr:hypothetical protein [Herminiimonas sp.]